MKILLFLISVILIFIYAPGWVKVVLLVLGLLIFLVLFIWSHQDPMSDTPPYGDGDGEIRTHNEVSPGVFKSETKAETRTRLGLTDLEEDETETNEKASENDEPK